MKLRLIRIGHESGQQIVHAINTDYIEGGTFCGAARVDWRYDVLLDEHADMANLAAIECLSCRAAAKTVLSRLR